MPPSGHTFLCEECGVLATSQFNLNSHLQGKRHRISMRKHLPTFCNICQRQCATPEHLVQHMAGQQHARVLARQGNASSTQTAVSRTRITDQQGCELCQIRIPEARRGTHLHSSNHQRRLRFAEYQKSINRSESSKYGISIASGEVDFGIIDYEEEDAGVDQFPMRKLHIGNSNDAPVQITSITDMRAKHKAYASPYQFSGAKSIIDEDSRGVIMIFFHLAERHVGYYETRIRLEFRNFRTNEAFVITRVVKAVVGNRSDLETLKPSAPYVPKAIPTPESFAPKLEVIDGIKPPQLADINWVVPLPQANIPAKLAALLKFDMDESVKERIKKLAKMFNKGWDRISYQSNYANMLWIEEEQLERDIRNYDLNSVEMSKQGQFYILEVPGLAENRPSVIVGDAVVARLCSSDKRWWKGYVHQVRQSEVVLGFKSTFAPFRGAKVDVQFTSSILLPSESMAISATQPTGAQTRLNWFNRNIASNLPQQKAVAAIVYRTSPLPFLLWGPPGTGKTSTAVEAIRQIIKLVPSAKILVSCPSNEACDLVTQRLDLNRSELFRLNAPTRKSSSVLPRVLDNSLVDDKGTFAVPAVERLKAFKVIVSTCVSASVLHRVGVPDGHFSHIFVDESGQAIESEVMIALQYATAATQEVLCGDPKQLGPIVRSPVASAFGLTKSYLSRMVELPAYSAAFRNKTFVKLTQNYRSHPAILRFPSEEFYAGELQPCADLAITNSLLHWEGFQANPRFPILFHSVIAQDSREARSPSFFNASEAIQVKSYVEQLVVDMKMTGESIGIISPYNAQVMKIRNLLQNSKILTKKHKDALKIGSVELFQGQERRAIILSTVRSSAQQVEVDLKHAIGFLANPRRFNVAVTRAQAGLIVVGNPDILGLDKLWRSFLAYVHKNKNWQGPQPTTWNPQDASEGGVDALEKMLADLEIVKVDMDEPPIKAEDAEDREWVRLEA